MTQLALEIGEAQPGLFSGDLPLFEKEQAWQYASTDGMRWPSDEPGYPGVLYRVSEGHTERHSQGYPKTQEEKLVYSGLVWNKPSQQEEATETSARAALADLADKIGDDEVAQHAIGILGIKVAELERPIRTDRHRRMAELIQKQRGNYFVMADFVLSHRAPKWELGIFAKLWGITVDENLRPEPVVAGKDGVLSRLETWPQIIGGQFLFKHARG
jgi:hypothetical protein